KQVLRAFLWEENRPIKQVELTWSPEAKRRPGNNDLVFSSLTGPTWWSKPRPTGGVAVPKVSQDGNTWVYTYPANTCGLIISVKDGAKPAADYDMPTVRVLVADVWKKMDIEIEWGFDQATAEKNYSGRIETYDGRLTPVIPLDGDAVTKVTDAGSWGSNGKAANRRGIKCSLLYMGSSTWRKTIPYHNFQEDVARSIITVWTKSGNFSFLAADLEHGPILAPEYGFFVRRTSTLATPAPATEAPISLASNATNARDFLKELQGKNQKTVRQLIRAREEQTWEGAVTGLCGTNQPPHPKVRKEDEPAMKVEVPSERLTAQWNLGPQHIAAAAKPNPKTGRKWFNDAPYGILAAETFMILTAHDQMGAFKDAEDGFFQWVSLPIDQNVSVKKGPRDPNGVHHQESLPDRPIGLFTDGSGSLTLAEGWGGKGGNMDGVHAFGPGSIGWSLIEHYRLSGDTKWFKEYGPRIKANAEWMLRQRHTVEKMLPGGERLWCKGIQPAMNMTPDGGQFLMHFYEAQGYYLAAVESCAQALVTIDPEGGAKLQAEAAAYRKDLQAAVERTIALSPVVAVRDGTYHSIIPFACYVRGFATGAWGWLR
ncbi:MAG: hypothetical protein WCI20_14405, partial [bacterium]